MRKIIIFLVLSIAVFTNLLPLPALAKEEKEKKVKVSELLKDANAIMSEAQDVYVDGDSDRAVDLYKKALVEIINVERQYPDRITSSEFAPLRFRRALCETEIDRILLEKVNVSSRSVAVTDTRELEQKRAERRAAASTNQFAKVSKKLAVKTVTGEVRIQPKASSSAKTEKKSEVKSLEKEIDVIAELDWAGDLLEAEKFEEAESSLIKVLRVAPDNFKARYLMALTRIRRAQFKDAQIIVEDLLEDYGTNEGVLLLAAGMYMSMEQYAKSMSTLDKALKIAPERPEAYLNMAWLLLEMNPRELNDPEMYYRRSIKLGGTRDYVLEKRLGIRQD